MRKLSPRSHSYKVLDLGFDLKQADFKLLLGPTLCCLPDRIERVNTSEDDQCLEQTSGRGVSRNQKGAVKRALEREAVTRMTGRHSVRYYRHFVSVERYIVLV